MESMVVTEHTYGSLQLLPREVASDYEGLLPGSVPKRTTNTYQPLVPSRHSPGSPDTIVFIFISYGELRRKRNDIAC